MNVSFPLRISLTRDGIPCRFYGVTGDDDAGEKIRQSLVEEDIDLTGLIKLEKGKYSKIKICQRCHSLKERTEGIISRAPLKLSLMR